MKKSPTLSLLALLLMFFWQIPNLSAAPKAVILGWNNLGMHCMDSRYGEFGILPPYNTIEAQLIVDGKLIIDPVSSGYRLTYEAINDPSGSINTTSIAKSDWATFAPTLLGLPSNWNADVGLVSSPYNCSMPGASNTPQPMYSGQPGAPEKSFHAEGIPITPYDNSGNKNTYPMMRLKAWSTANPLTPVAQTDIVVPVSDEMSCKSCHAPGTDPNNTSPAKPSAGWITNANPDREVRLNILKKHDDVFSGQPLYTAALNSLNIADGLYANAIKTPPKPVMCASCHASEALGTPGYATTPSLTSSMHSRHASTTPPGGIALDSDSNRSACYECHPGSATKCLRGAMGSAVAADGSMEMQCQSCHGNMSQVGNPARTGWLQEPNCQSCHTGTATSNAGQIRYLSVFDNTQPGSPVRSVSNQTFATNPDTPAAGVSLYRFSKGHGNLQCSACHGSTHAEFPSSHQNDNVRNIALQGHTGMNVECKSCHTTSGWTPSTPMGGPHGMHALDQNWVDSHHDVVSQVGLANCQSCHGTDYRGTVLSRVQGDRSFNDKFSQKFYRGATVGCYSCHNGPNSSNSNTSAAPSTAGVSGVTAQNNPLDLVIPGNVAGVTLRILTQAQHGSVGLKDGIATYFPDQGFSGTDSFTFSGYDGSKNSNDVSVGTVVKASTANITISGTGTAPSGVMATLSQNAGSSINFTTTPNPLIISGDALHFKASASNASSYQWYKNGWPIAGATTANFDIASATAGDSGSYVVLASNSFGALASKPAIAISVLTPPSITSQPAGQTVNAGSNVSLSVIATGTSPLSYQWYKDNLILSGKTGSALNLSNVSLTSAGSYTVKVSNPAGTVTSTAAVLTVNQAPIISKQPTNQSVNQGAAATFSVTASAYPAPTYQWYRGTTAVGTNSATLTLNPVQLSDAGSYTVVISNTQGTVTSTPATLAVKANSVTAVTSSLNPATYGSAVTFSATITGNTPTGTVTFKDGSSTLATASVSGNLATYTTSTLIAGNHTISAAYAGDGNNTASVSPTLSQTINKATTTVAVVSNLASTTKGQALTLTATVSGGSSASGKVNFVDGTTTIGSATLTNGSASFTTSTLAVGSHLIQAVYAGDSNNLTSTSATITQVITKAVTATTLTSSLNPSTAGKSVSFTATVSGGSAATGSVSFMDGASKLGTGTVASGKATFSTSKLAKGTHSISASYPGDSNNNASVSAALTQTVN